MYSTCMFRNFLLYSTEQLDCCNYGLLHLLYLYICVDTVHYLPYLNLCAEFIMSNSFQLMYDALYELQVHSVSSMYTFMYMYMCAYLVKC